MLLKIWGKFPVSEFHQVFSSLEGIRLTAFQNCPPAFEVQDKEWFMKRYPNTVLVHKVQNTLCSLDLTQSISVQSSHSAAMSHKAVVSGNSSLL